MRLIRRYSFEAAHQLHGLADDHPCMRLHGHGYKLEVAYEGPVDGRGMVIEYSELDALVKPVLDRYDHRFINDFLDQPTVENMAPDIWALMPRGVVGIRLWETERSSVEYP